MEMEAVSQGDACLIISLLATKRRCLVSAYYSLEVLVYQRLIPWDRRRFTNPSKCFIIVAPGVGLRFSRHISYEIDVCENSIQFARVGFDIYRGVYEHGVGPLLDILNGAIGKGCSNSPSPLLIIVAPLSVAKVSFTIDVTVSENDFNWSETAVVISSRNFLSSS